MANTRTKSSTTSQTLDDLLGKPALVKGEDEARYRRLQAAVRDEIQPQDFFDEIRVSELTAKLWDQRRDQYCVAALVETSFIGALAGLLRRHLPRPPTAFSIEALDAEDKASLVAKEYFDANTTAKRRNELTALLKQYAITDEQIRANAMVNGAASIQLFKRMEENNEKSIRRALKDHDRRFAEQAKQEQSIDPDEETDS